VKVNDWKDVDAALEEMGLLDIEIGIALASLAENLHSIISKHSAQVGPLQKKREAIEELVNAFCLQNKAEFAKKRSKQLVFGKVAFKVSEKIEFLGALEATVIATLKKLGHTDCVNTRESVDKQAAKQLEDNELTRCGLRRTREDNFRIEPNLKEIAKKIGTDCQATIPRLDLDKIVKLIGSGEKEESAEKAAA